MGFVNLTRPPGSSVEDERCVCKGEMGGKAAGRQTSQEVIAVILMGNDVA